MYDKIREFVELKYVNQTHYGDGGCPDKILGRHMVTGGQIICGYDPNAISMELLEVNNSVHTMVDMDGFHIYAIFLPREDYFPYKFRVIKKDGTTIDKEDCYRFPLQITQTDLFLFHKGVHYEIYDKLGAHPKVIDGVEGVYFAVWAPNANRISVVGEFNDYDCRIHKMIRRSENGIFELFIPNLPLGITYQYEIKTKLGDIIKKTDPYGNFQQIRPGKESIITDLDKYQWKDKEFITNRGVINSPNRPMAIYEVHLGSWRRKEGEAGDFLSYRQLAHELAQYVTYMGYTHVELIGMAEHPYDGSWGYQVTGYYAPTSRFGTPYDFMYFVDYMHAHNIGVIIDWVPGHFPKDEHGLSKFDGTCVYEYEDVQKAEQVQWGTLVFDYSKKEVTNFLVANGLFWLDKFHIDGLRTDAVASMIYLDFGKDYDKWQPNRVGDNCNLEAVEFLKHLNDIVKKRYPDVLVIAEESTAWPKVTGEVKDGSLGFDYKWNMGWMHDFLDYMKEEPKHRMYHQDKLTMSMNYHYGENYILVLSHDEVVHEKRSILGKMPGDHFYQFANVRAAYGFMFAHPGKKLLFMGQDFGQWEEWCENKELDWDLLEYPIHKQLQSYMRDLIHFYSQQKALYEADNCESSFEWIIKENIGSSIIVFARKTASGKDNLLFVCNFSDVTVFDFCTGVPVMGRYDQVFNSDLAEYGGISNICNNNICAQPNPHDGREQSIKINLPPLAILAFQY